MAALPLLRANTSCQPTSVYATCTGALGSHLMAGMDEQVRTVTSEEPTPPKVVKEIDLKADTTAFPPVPQMEWPEQTYDCLEVSPEETQGKVNYQPCDDQQHDAISIVWLTHRGWTKYAEDCLTGIKCKLCPLMWESRKRHCYLHTTFIQARLDADETQGRRKVPEANAPEALEEWATLPVERYGECWWYEDSTSVGSTDGMAIGDQEAMAVEARENSPWKTLPTLPLM